MKLKTKTSYNLVYDDLKDNGIGHISGLLARALFAQNVSQGLEVGIPFIADLGVSVSNTEPPAYNLVVISQNQSYAESIAYNLTENIAEVILYLLNSIYDCEADIRRVKALCKGYKKTQSEHKYLYCYYNIVCELPDTVAEVLVNESLDNSAPFYIKTKKLIELLSSFTRTNVEKLLYFHSIWGTDTLLSLVLYLTNDRPLPEYIVNEYEDEINSTPYKANLINLSLALGRNQFPKFITQKLIEVSQ